MKDILRTDITAQVNDLQYIKEVIHSRELFYFFAWRDTLVRYKQAVFGVTWAIIRPLLTMCVFAILFGRVARFSSGDVSYPLFVLLPMLLWQLFSAAIADGANSLVVNANMLTKIYFPRMVLPISSIVVHFVDFLVGLTFFVCAVFIWGPYIPPTALLLPLIIAHCLILCVAINLWLSALTVKYRDFRFIVPFTIQFGLFISPVGYPSAIVPHEWLWIYSLNPLVGIIESARWAVLGTEFAFLPQAVVISVTITLGLLLSGYHYFRDTEHDLADII